MIVPRQLTARQIGKRLAGLRESVHGFQYGLIFRCFFVRDEIIDLCIGLAAAGEVHVIHRQQRQILFKRRNHKRKHLHKAHICCHDGEIADAADFILLYIEFHQPVDADLCIFGGIAFRHLKMFRENLHAFADCLSHLFFVGFCM